MALYAVKNGIPGVGVSSNPDFYLLSFNLRGNIGYVGQSSRGWKFYTSSASVIKKFIHLCLNGKYNFYGESLHDCLIEVERITGIKPIVIDSSEIEDIRCQIKQERESTAQKEICIEPDTLYFNHILDNLVGLWEVKNEINALRSFAKVRAKKIELGVPVTPNTLHMVFTGNPGTGKTTVARLIADIYKEIGLLPTNNCVEVARNNLVGDHIGQTALLTTEVFEKSIGGVLFIDEAYSLSKGYSKDFGNEAIETLVKLMEDYRESIVVIIAGYTKEMNQFLNSNPGLKSRFSTYIQFPDYSKEELLLIFKKMVTDIQHTISEGGLFKMEMLIDEYYDKGAFAGNARTIRNIFESMQKNQALRIEKSTVSSKELLITFIDSDVPSSVK